MILSKSEKTKQLDKNLAEYAARLSANEFKTFSARACTWQKIPIRLQVCEAYANSVCRVRAADCNSFVRKALWGFPDSLNGADRNLSAPKNM